MSFCADHDRHRRRGDIRAIARYDEIDLVDIEQLCVDAGHLRRVGLIVIIDEFDRAAEQPALGVDVVRPDLHGQEAALAVDRERAGQRHRKPDRDRLAARRLLLGEGRGRKQQPRRERAGHAAEPAPLSSCHHEYPRIRFRSSAGRGGRRSISAPRGGGTAASKPPMAQTTGQHARIAALSIDCPAIDCSASPRDYPRSIHSRQSLVASPSSMTSIPSAEEVVASGNRSKQSAVTRRREDIIPSDRPMDRPCRRIGLLDMPQPLRGRSRYCNAAR